MVAYGLPSGWFACFHLSVKEFIHTVFIRLSALGAYLIFGPSGWALIRGGRLFEAGRLLNFHHFQQGKGLFCNKTINNNKT